MTPNGLRIEFVDSLALVDADQWNSLWISDGFPNRSGYPFTRYEYLAALETSGCVNAKTGWQPQHCLIWDDSRLVAAMPLYAKTHSYGEYVFDWSWANAYHQSGFEYYPKLLNAIPFTPATGPRWALATNLPIEQQQRLQQALFDAIAKHVQRQGYSSFHSLFAQATQRESLLASTLLPVHARFDCQFHWFNQGYESFADFLETFNARKRKNVKKERQKVMDQHIDIAMIEGEALTRGDWHGFSQLYQRTYLKRSGHTGYLNEAFFQSVGQALPQNLVMAKAVRNGEWLAAALYFRDEQTLYGRYWGAIEDIDGLHFECCYYQGIEYAIAKKLLRFDPGAQGEHKIARGFTPVLTSSLHHIAHPGFERAIRDFLREEQGHIEQYCQQARTELPFKEGSLLVDADRLLDPHFASANLS